MKNLITSTACVMILLAFVLQFAQNQMLHNRIMAVDQAVNSFKEVVKQEGRISKENEAWLRSQLSSILGCQRDRIRISGTTIAVYRGELIQYRVKVPLEDLLAAPLFWGLGEGQNQTEYEINQYTTSEFIGR